MTIQDENQECEKALEVDKEMGRTRIDLKTPLLTEYERLEGSDKLIVGRRIDPLVLSHTIEAEIKPWSLKDKLQEGITSAEYPFKQDPHKSEFKQCLNYQHCGWYVGCGKDSSGNPVPGYQVKEGLCTNCNHWEELVEKIDDPEIYSIRIEGQHYQTHKNYLFRRPGKYNGFGGRKFVIKIHPKDTEPYTDGTLIVTHDLWTQGTIPEHFKDRLFDNAEFLNEVTERTVFDGEDFITCFDVNPRHIE
jgi:hypothetical protein